jgi:endonuclease YncB( thermonuclease family)
MFQQFKVALLSFLGLLLVLLCLHSESHAQSGDNITVRAFAIDNANLRPQGQDFTIQLWGIDPVMLRNSLTGLRARIALDDAIDSKAVTCSIKSRNRARKKILAQCFNESRVDLALDLVSQGFAIISRSDIAGTPQQERYINTEKRARLQGLGIWETLESGVVDAPGNANNASTNTTTSAPQTPANIHLFSGDNLMVLLVLVAGPMIGMLIVGVILYIGLSKLVRLQTRHINARKKDERKMRDREKFVLASALEGEINTNRAKIDAFLLIYEDLLRNLRDPSKTPKYKQSGDVVHQRPSLNRAVFDSNSDKFDLLGPQLVVEITEIYTRIDPNPDYITLEPETPIEHAIEKVQKIILESERMIEPLDKISSALSVILRGNKGSMNKAASKNTLA